MRYFIGCLMFCLLTMNTYATTNDTAIKINWGYKGHISPAHWGALNPSFALCANGKMQSPINISKKVKKQNDQLMIQYQTMLPYILDNGATKLTLGNEQIVVNTGHGIQINYHGDDEKESIIFADRKYHLVQFHFHTPSENEWHGRAFPLEIHFVNQSDDGKIAVIGVFARAGGTNEIIENIIQHLPTEEKKEIAILDHQINPAQLLPIDKDYYHFIGSLTTPPCTEGVQWIVMQDTITASPAQILQLRQATGGVNARPVQPLNRRKIFFSEGTK
ncbi:MAG: Carbonic anhydrase [uncultured bacterium]|nr:MAG: Carbonic anhydrase [uncultured bacterium]